MPVPICIIITEETRQPFTNHLTTCYTMPVQDNKEPSESVSLVDRNLSPSADKQFNGSHSKRDPNRNWTVNEEMVI